MKASLLPYSSRTEFLAPKTPVSLNPYFHRKNCLNVKKLAVRGGEKEGKGESVDDDMIVLRMRIKKLKALEAAASSESQDSSLVARTKSITNYKEDFCEGAESLQSHLMNARPRALALGMLALLVMSGPLSESGVLGDVWKVARRLLAGCHVSIDIDF